MGDDTAARVRAERGSVTAETAVVLPVLVVTASLAVWAVGVVATRLACVEAARAGARAAARGEPAELVRARVRDIPGTHAAQVEVRRDGDRVTVVVRAPTRPPLPLPALVLAPAVVATAHAVAEGVPGQPPGGAP